MLEVLRKCLINLLLKPGESIQSKKKKYRKRKKTSYIEKEVKTFLIPEKELFKIDTIKARLLVKVISIAEYEIKTWKEDSPDFNNDEDTNFYQITLDSYKDLLTLITYRLGHYKVGDKEELTEVEQIIQKYRAQIEANDLAYFLKEVQDKYEASSEIVNASILLYSRISSLTRNKNQGLIRTSHFSKNNIELTLSCLDLLNEIHVELIEGRLPTD